MANKTILNVRPRETISWKDFVKTTPEGSVALDGFVLGGPRYDEKTRHLNLDHHDKVVREATMSTSRQALFAVKGNLMKHWLDRGDVNLFVNDPDQDASLAAYILSKPKLFEGVQSVPILGRLIELTDRLDITAGGFPMNLDDSLVATHNWVFDPYNSLRISGALATADEGVIRDCIEAVWGRIDKLMMGDAGQKELDTRHEVLYESPFGYKILNEIGGSEARYFLFANGLDAFISQVATRPDGNRVMSVGRRSRYVPFPVNELFPLYNEAEGLSQEEGWGGSDIIGGSSRMHGTALTNEQLAEITDAHLARKYGGKE